MLKILARTTLAALLFVNVTGTVNAAEMPTPLWQSLLAGKVIQVQSTATDQKRQICMDNCTTKCTMQFNMCSGTDTNYINTVCRPQNKACVSQCNNQC